MGRHNYTSQEIMWLQCNCRAKKWDSVKSFVDTFNKRFSLSISPDALTNYMRRHNIPYIDCVTTDNNKTLTDEQKQWILDNCGLGIFKDKKHFIATFNAVFNENKTFDAMNTYLARNNIVLITKASMPAYTEAQRQWILDNYDNYDVFADLVRDFNAEFHTNKAHASLTGYCVNNLKLREFDRHRENAGQFKKGLVVEESPIGTIKYNKQRNLCFIKVQMCKGKSRDTSGHNLKAPFWKPLQDKIWEDHCGTIPEGYIACSLTGDPYEQNIENIALIDKRGKCIMSKKDWWSDKPKFTATAVQWCNLYMTAKDREVI